MRLAPSAPSPLRVTPARLALTAALLTLLSLPACRPSDTQPDSPDDARATDAPPTDPNLLTVSPAVQRNLGITFAQVERRAVTQTLRVPGQFELTPSAQRDYHAPVAGRIELLVQQYQPVAAGDILATIDAPGWRALQSALTEAQAAIATADAAVLVAESTQLEQTQRIALLEDRIARLATAEVRRVELDNELSQARLVLPRLQAELDAARANANAARAAFDAHLLTAASTTGLPLDQLTANAANNTPAWRALDAVPITAASDGVVDNLNATSGRWLETGEELLTVIQPDRLRFRAEALLGDAGTLSSGLPATLAPPRAAAPINDAATGTLLVGPVAHAADRTVALYVTPDAVPDWARAGGAGFLEVTLNPDAPTELALPRSALVQDGLELVFFRRDPANPQQVRRVLADTGQTDGRWTEVFSGVGEGDEVVIDGVYQLLAASSSTMQEGGHFHADGTFHESDDH